MQESHSQHERGEPLLASITRRILPPVSRPLSRVRSISPQRTTWLAVAQVDGPHPNMTVAVDILLQNFNPSPAHTAHDGGVVWKAVTVPRTVRVGVLEVHILKLKDVPRTNAAQRQRSTEGIG